MSAIQQTLAGIKQASVDPDAQAFLTATGITDPTISSAVNTLVVSMKADSIWTKMVALYPFVGGTSTTHKYNLKNTATFQITFNGSITHDANGITGDGATGYADTGLVPNTNLTDDDAHMSLYCRTNSSSASIRDAGSQSNSNTRLFNMNIRLSDNFNIAGDVNTIDISVANLNSQGHYVYCRPANNSLIGYKNATNVVSSSTADSSAPSTSNLFFCARNLAGSASGFSSRNYAFASAGAGLTPTNVTNFYTAVQAFQTTLSRQV